MSDLSQTLVDRTPEAELEKFILGNTQNAKALIAYVKERLDDGANSVAMCFRGDYICLYYRCHKLLQITLKRGKIVGEFNFRHARFTENYRDIQKTLTDLKVTNFKDGAYSGPVRFDLSGKEAVKPDGLVAILEIYRQLIDDFSDPTKWHYAFDVKGKGVRLNKSKNLEKDRQQELYSQYFYNTDQTIYDLEYAEHRAADHGVSGRFDLLGIKKEDGSYYLEFIELKSNPKSCGSGSGIEKHVEDYKNYLENEELVNQRKQEACRIIKLTNKLFARHSFEDLTPDKLHARVRFVLTDEANKDRYIFKLKALGIEVTGI